MSTRGFVGWKIDGKITTTYNHSDSYPSGVGVDLLRALAKELDSLAADLAPAADPGFQTAAAISILGAKFRVIRSVTENQKLSKATRKHLAHRHNPGVSFGEDTYALLRHQQGDIAAMLEDRLVLRAHTDWPRESLFCEWGYLVNFDTPTPSLEIYRGFQESSPTQGEWANTRPLMQPVYGPTPDGSGHAQNGQWGVVGRKRSEYYPVERVAAYPLAQLSSPETEAALLNLEED